MDPTYRECLLIAGNEALAQGAHEVRCLPRASVLDSCREANGHVIFCLALQTALNFLVASEKLSAASGAWKTERTEMFELSLTLVGCVLSPLSPDKNEC